MNVLILTDERYPYHIGGAGVVASQTAQALIGKNIHCSINCSNPKNRFLRKIYNALWPIWALFVYSFSLIKKNDLIVVNDLRSAYILGMIGCKKILNKTVYIIHGTEIDIVYRARSKKNTLIFLPFFYSRFLRSCNKIVYVSHYVASRTQDELFQRKIVPRNELVSYAGLNAAMQNLALHLTTLATDKYEPIRLVSFSRLEKRKGYLEMISIFESLVKKGNDLVWDIYGKGSLENDINNLLKEKKLDTRVRMMGKLDRDSLSNHINPNSYDAYWLLPNEPEAFGLTFIESSAAGLPVIGPKKYGIEEAICENQSGFFYEDPKQLMCNLIQIKNHKFDFMVSCKKWATRFSADNFINDILN